MPRSLTSALITEKNELYSDGRWMWLLEVEIDDSNAARLCGADHSVSYGGFTWSPFPMQIEALPASSDGELPRVTLTVSNITREMGEWIEDAGIIDRKARVLVFVEQTGEAIEWASFEILGASVTLQAAQARLGVLSPLDAPFPAQRFHRTRCRHTYGEAGCGYDRSQANAIAVASPAFDPTTCDLTLDGANGCRVHGDNEVANGRPRLHPMRCGIFPGIPKGRGRS